MNLICFFIIYYLKFTIFIKFLIFQFNFCLFKLVLTQFVLIILFFKFCFSLLKFDFFFNLIFKMDLRSLIGVAGVVDVAGDVTQDVGHLARVHRINNTPSPAALSLHFNTNTSKKCNHFIHILIKSN